MKTSPYVITGEKRDIEIEVIGFNVRISILDSEGNERGNWEESLLGFAKRIGLNYAMLLPFRSLNVRKLKNAIKQNLQPAMYEGNEESLVASIHFLALRTEIIDEKGERKTIETTETPIVQLLAGLGVPISPEIVIAASQMHEEMVKGRQ